MLTLGAGETATSQLFSLSTLGNAFDDGFLLNWNGSTVLDFDYDDYSTNSDFNAIFGGSWEPWFGQGAPQITIDSSGNLS